MAKIWATRFAEAGDKITLPVPAEADGSVSVTQGWTPDYELPDTDADYKPVGRDEMNGALFEITDSVRQLQQQGAAEWSADLAPYPKGAEVVYAGERWYSPVAGNSTEPGAVGTTWTLAGAVPAASETVLGIVERATNAEVAAATDTTRYTSPASVGAAYMQKGYMLVRDEKPQGTNGGSVTGNTTVTRALNTVAANTISGASLASNQFTLPAGTYRIKVSAPCTGGNGHKASLYNVTDAVTAAVGTSENTTRDAADDVTTSSIVLARLTLAAPKTFEVRHFVQQTKSGSGLGVNVDAPGLIEIYTYVEIEREGS